MPPFPFAICGLSWGIMADFSNFTSSSFDPSEWVNRALRDDDDGTATTEQIDAHLAKLSMKLQLMAQDCGDSLESAMAEATTVMWRTSNDVVSVEKSVASLQTAIQQLSEHIGANQSRNIAGVDELFRLDIIKRNMEQSKAILVEAAQWHQLVQEARAALSGQANLKAAAEKVEALQRCLQVLKPIPEHAARESVLQELKSTLMSKLQPKLQSEIAADDPLQLQELVYVFRIMGAETQASDQYIQRKPFAIAQQWDVLQSSSAQGRQFVQEFAKICASVQAMMRDEAHTTPQLFGAAAAPGLLCAMLKHIFEHQKAGLGSRLKQLGMGYDEMSACYHITSQMLQDVIPFVQDARIGDLRPGYAASLEPYLASQDVFVSKLTAQLRDQMQQMLITVRDGVKAVATLDDILGEDVAIDGANMGVMDAFVDICKNVMGPYTRSVQSMARFAGGVACRHHNVQMNQILAESLQSLRQTLLSLRVAAGLSAEESTAEGPGHQTREERTSQASPAPAPASPTAIERSEFVQAALRALHGVAFLVSQIEQTETATSNEYIRCYDELFGATVVSEDAAQIVGSMTASDFTKHVVNFLADTKQFGLADVRKFLYQFHARTSPEMGDSALVFGPSSRAIQSLRVSGNMLLLDVCLDGLRQLLGDMPKLPVWTASSSGGDGDSDPIFAASPSEALNPQRLFTQLGDWLLALVNLFDEFAESVEEQLEVVKTDPVSMKLAFDGWKALASQLDPERRLDVQSYVIDYTRTRQAIQAAEQATVGSSTSDAGERSRAASEVSSIAADHVEPNFTDQWLRCVADAVVGLVLHHTLRIRKLAKSGRAQLLTDLGYLANVLDTLTRVLPPLLPHAIKLLDEDAEIAHKRFKAPTGTNFVRVFENRILALREDFD